MENWQPARLIPVTGIAKGAEAEQRATSALLAVLRVVRPYSKSLLGPLGASKADKANVESFIEVTLKASGGKSVRPDGLLRVSFGRTEPWVLSSKSRPARRRFLPTRSTPTSKSHRPSGSMQ